MRIYRNFNRYINIKVSLYTKKYYDISDKNIDQKNVIVYFFVWYQSFRWVAMIVLNRHGVCNSYIELLSGT